MININANDAADSLSSLKLQLKSILDLFDPKSRIYYIDYPVHNNIGDSLINIGTEQFFLEHNIPIYQRYSALNMPDKSQLIVDEYATFLCHGGGNFGDLYPEHQNVREWLVDNFPHARIVCLPQSLYYSSPDAQRASLEKFARHSSCHILTRDQESLDILRHARITQSSMMPDMAHQLWGSLKATSPRDQKHNMYFLRRDQESTPPPPELAEAFANHSVDWNNIISLSHKALARSVSYLFMTPFLTADMKVSLWYSVRDKMIRDAVTYFSHYDHVYTNRLHAMILALLLGRNVTAFDNSYGKLSRYAHTWLT